jgi:hypothetical protein
MPTTRKDRVLKMLHDLTQYIEDNVEGDHIDGVITTNYVPRITSLPSEGDKLFYGRAGEESSPVITSVTIEVKFPA